MTEAQTYGGGIDDIRLAAQRLLDAHDAFMRGEHMTPEQLADERRVRNAAIYGAAAFMAAPDQDHGAHASARAFLLALIDPLHPDLDYLRADPAAGQVARDAREASEAQANEADHG